MLQQVRHTRMIHESDKENFAVLPKPCLRWNDMFCQIPVTRDVYTCTAIFSLSMAAAQPPPQPTGKLIFPFTDACPEDIQPVINALAQTVKVDAGIVFLPLLTMASVLIGTKVRLGNTDVNPSRSWIVMSGTKSPEYKAVHTLLYSPIVGRKEADAAGCVVASL